MIEINIENNSRKAASVKVGGYENPLVDKDCIVRSTGIKIHTNGSFVGKSLIISTMSLIGLTDSVIHELNESRFHASIIQIETRFIVDAFTSLEITNILPGEKLRLLISDQYNNQITHSKTIKIGHKNKILILL